MKTVERKVVPIRLGTARTRTVVAALAALAQETRLGIFRLLVQAGPDGMAAGEIARRLDLAPATLSFHLAQLSHAGLLESRRESRSIIYAPNFAEINGLIGYLVDNCCEGSSCGVRKC
jgi:DNA-binding transcriptional ArsR family regulator